MSLLLFLLLFCYTCCGIRYMNICVKKEENYSDDTMISDDNIFDYRNISEDSNVMEKSILKSAIIIGNKYK